MKKPFGHRMVFLCLKICVYIFCSKTYFAIISCSSAVHYIHAKKRGMPFPSGLNDRLVVLTAFLKDILELFFII